MKRLDEFRIYYNHTIHPELLRLDAERRRLLRNIFIATIFFLFFFFFQIFFLHLLALTLALCIPAFILISYFLNKLRIFKARFKPHVVNLILDFIDNEINYGTLVYKAKKAIPSAQFFESRLFVPNNMVAYDGEDYIAGQIGQIPFELCELSVKELSPIRSRVQESFRGVFLRAHLNASQIALAKHLRLLKRKGDIIILPEQLRPSLSKTIKTFTRTFGKEVEEQLHNIEFQNTFMTYATKEADLNDLLSSEVQEVLLHYRAQSKREIYVSFIDNITPTGFSEKNEDDFIIENYFYIAITETQDEDMLEPFLFQTNVNFDIIYEFYEKLILLFSIVEDIDKNN